LSGTGFIFYTTINLKGALGQQIMAMDLLIFYILPLLVIVTFYLYNRQKKDAEYETLTQKQVEAGLTEPTSLHPVFDHDKCLGCSSCVLACPEKNVIGIISGKATLITPSKCIGHGACKLACPVNGITLVFGTEKRGVDIPFIQENFETNVPGIFIAGELGGMGLIRNAVTQGRQAVESVAARIKKNGKIDGVHDIVIIGAGPAGFSASLAALEKGLDYVTVEQDTLGGTVAHYPRGKVVMTQPAVLPLIGATRFREISKEKLLMFWQEAEKKAGIKINYSERVDKIIPGDGRLTVVTSQGSYPTQAVVLAIGRRGTPRKLGVPGEDKSKVVYRLIDPEQYRSKAVLVVGGGDSALEAALSLSEMIDTEVTLSYRGEAFGRVKPQNRDRIEDAQKQGRINVLLNSHVQEVRGRNVDIVQEEKTIPLKNDIVIVCAGGLLPTTFLKEIGVQMETKYGKS
jgi:thioredoxin reductase/Pyruvate/2-oxoacid:ferredoxin oxidoreductase delta subunit